MSYCENCGWKESECRCTPDDVPLQAAGQSPSLPPGSPSGVVFRTLEDGETILAGDQLWVFGLGPWSPAPTEMIGVAYAEVWGVPYRRSLPQAPATPAAAPVEGEDGKFPICPNCTTSDLTVRHIPPVTNCPNTPAPGVEAPRKEARETQLFTREVCPECKNSDVADCLGALPCPHCSGGYIYTEVREGDNHE